MNCTIKNNPTSYREMIEKADYRINNKRLEELSKMGYSKFKIAGRLLSGADWFEVMCYYLIKPEYIDKAIN